MGYAAGLHRQALVATGLVLFVLIIIINYYFSMLEGGNLMRDKLFKLYTHLSTLIVLEHRSS